MAGHRRFVAWRKSTQALESRPEKSTFGGCPVGSEGWGAGSPRLVFSLVQVGLCGLLLLLCFLLAPEYLSATRPTASFNSA